MLVAALTYFNFGFFHFGNFIHDWEWTHYYVGSKYFTELSYDRLYECIAVADVEAGLRRRVELRKLTNLRTNVLESSAEIVAHPERCKQHFSPARWEAFKHDVTLLPRPAERQALGRPADRSRLQRHAGLEHRRHAAGQHRARPARPSSTRWPCSIRCTSRAPSPWSGGPSAGGCSASALLVFATNFPSRFYWTGGSFLRWDWLFYTVAAICCLRKERPVLGGRGAGLRHVVAGLSRCSSSPGPLLGLGYALWQDTAGSRLRGLHPVLRGRGAGHGALLVPLSLAVSGGVAAPTSASCRTPIKHKETPLTNYMGLRTVLAWRPGEVGRLLKDERLTDPWMKWKEARLRAARQAPAPLRSCWRWASWCCWGWPPAHVEPWMAAALGVTFIPIGRRADLLLLRLHHRRWRCCTRSARRWGAGCCFLTAFTQFVAWAPLPGMATLARRAVHVDVGGHAVRLRSDRLAISASRRPRRTMSARPTAPRRR